MTENQGYNAYTNSIESNTHFDQLIMLYDGAIKYVVQAKDALENQEYDKRFNLLNRASSIIHGLRECLDLEKGGETAEALSQAYHDLDIQIIFSTTSDNPEVYDKVIDKLKQLRDSWEEAITEYNNHSSSEKADIAQPVVSENDGVLSSIEA